MEDYALQKWLLLFFIYCFLGYVWEVCYVSFCQKKWTNRGFLFGPFLPIYGFGAIIILFTTLPVSDNMFGIFCIGTLSATLLELVTGIVMEKLFYMKYWDYSRKKFNYKGYICLSSTIAWGFFSILLVDGINVPITNFINRFNTQAVNFLSTILLIAFTADTVKSVQNALDLRKLLKTIYNNNVAVHNIVDYVENVSVKLSEGSEDIYEHIQNFKEIAKQFKEEKAESISNRQNELSFRITDSINKITTELKNEKDLIDKEFKETALYEFISFKSKLNLSENIIKDIDFKDFKGAIKLLKRNPSAHSKELEEEIEQVKKF